MPLVRMTEEEKKNFYIYQNGIRQFKERLSEEKFRSRFFRVDCCDLCFSEGKTIPYDRVLVVNGKRIRFCRNCLKKLLNDIETELNVIENE